MKERNRQVIEQFRAGGPIEGMHRDRIVLLTTTGRRSGRVHTTPMMFVRDDDRLLVVASDAGARKAPDWYHNLVADSAVTVEIGDERYSATATPLTGDEYAEKWASITSQYTFFTDHEKSAGRRIPVVALVRR